MPHDIAAGGNPLDQITRHRGFEAPTAVAASDAQLVENQIDVFRALGGGWQVQPARPQ